MSNQKSVRAKKRLIAVRAELRKIKKDCIAANQLTSGDSGRLDAAIEEIDNVLAQWWSDQVSYATP